MYEIYQCGRALPPQQRIHRPSRNTQKDRTSLRSAGELTRRDLFAATACAGSGNTQIPWMNIDRRGGEALPRATGTKCRKMSAPLARSNSIAPYLIFCSKLVYLFRVPLRQSEKPVAVARYRLRILSVCTFCPPLPYSNGTSGFMS